VHVCEHLGDMTYLNDLLKTGWLTKKVKVVVETAMSKLRINE